MSKRSFYLIIGLFFLAACQRYSDKFDIEGHLYKGQGRKVYLQELTVDNDGPIDSMVIDRQGNFKFKGQIEIPKFFTLRVSPNNFITLLIDKGDNIFITGQYKDLSKTYHISGSTGSMLMHDLTCRLNKSLASIDSLNAVYLRYRDSTKIDSLRDALDKSFDKIADSQRKYTFDFINGNIQSLSCIMALYQQFNPHTLVVRPEIDYKYFFKVDSSLTQNYSNSPYVENFHSYVESLKEKLKVKGARRALLGSFAPDITLNNQYGSPVTLSGYQEKYVLLVFWASWCPPCRLENKNLVILNHKYRSAGFVIFQVSLDKSRDAWIKAIREDRMYWTQVSDLKEWNSSVVPLYGLERIPTCYLLDPNSRIIAINLHGPALGKKLKEIYGY